MRWPEKFPTELKLLKYEIEEYARQYGLDFYEVIFEVVDYDKMNEIAAYGGFPVRYPHWRFGMEYEQLSKGYAYGLQKIYEMVINNDPCYAYLLRSNEMVDQKLVMAHVYGHCDFFKNNMWFSRTNRKMMDEVANHGTRIRRYMERHGVDEVESFIDTCLSVEDLIDPHDPFIRRRRERGGAPLEEEVVEERHVHRLKSKGYMDRYVNPANFLDEQKEKIEAALEKERHFPEEPERDVLRFLLDCAPLENWQRDVLSLVREEAYYFTPQRQTKILNEGWACVVPDTLIYTDQGLLRAQDLVEQRRPVRISDGETARRVYDWASFEERETVWVRTRRGLEIEGSATHRLMMEDGTWRRLDEVHEGDKVRVASGANLWPEEQVALHWQPGRRLTLGDIARKAGVSLWTVIRHKDGKQRSKKADILDPLLSRYRYETTVRGRTQHDRRAEMRIPEKVDANLGAFLGYLLSNGNISECERVVTLTTDDEPQADRFAELAMRLFDLKPKKVLCGSRWRIHLYSLHLIEFLQYLGLKTGPCARIKTVPETILKSPKPVIAAFVSAYFDGDGYAGEHGAILSSLSEDMVRTLQIILLNFGILSRRRQQNDGGWHLHITGKSAGRFMEEVGFGLERKQAKLRAYVEERQWFKEENLADEIATVEERRSPVYDISVEETHRYAAHGFVNHNSYWHVKIMTQKALNDAELIDFAQHHAGTMGMRPGRINPYKLGLELLLHIEDCWNKGKFGSEYEQCEDMERRRQWDTGLGKGMEKIFEVRRVHNDISFIDNFLTEEFCREQKLFTYGYNRQRDAYAIESREFARIKRQLLFGLTNFGQPIIQVKDGDYRHRGELLLSHQFAGVGLDMDYARATLQNVRRLWGRPVHIETEVEDQLMLLSCENGEVTFKRAS